MTVPAVVLNPPPFMFSLTVFSKLMPSPMPSSDRSVDSVSSSTRPPAVRKVPTATDPMVDCSVMMEWSVNKTKFETTGKGKH